MKVFGIGFHKTATTSLAVALYTLGYNVTGYFGVHDPDISQNARDKAFQLADRFDAAQDTPWFVLYKDLDVRYPHSKFILTVRQPEKWIKSVTDHFKRHYIPAHEWIYGVKTAVGNEDIYIQHYLRHNQEVQEYFRDRPDDFLKLDIPSGDGWEKLCQFLGEQVPDFDFPFQNASHERRRQLLHRGLNFIKRRIIIGHEESQANQMSQGVSATFVRDIIHFHYLSFNKIWEYVDYLNENQFSSEVQGIHTSIRDLILDQMAEEARWIRILSADDMLATMNVQKSTLVTKDEVHHTWRSHMQRMRFYVANLNDDACNKQFTENKVYAWEVLVQIMNAGIERRILAQEILRSHHLIMESPSLIDLLHSKTYK